MSCLPALIFETSTPAASLALIRLDGSIEELRFSSDRSHNALLFQPLEALIAKLSGEIPALVLVGSGPGSYSGTRVGIAAAQGVAIAFGCPAIAVPSVLAVPAADAGKACLAIGDARRGSYWTAWIENHRMVSEPILTDRDGLERAISEALEKRATVFSFEDPSKLPLPESQLAEISQQLPDATRLWHAWQQTPGDIRETWKSQVPQPMYLKPPHITPAKRSWLNVP